MPAPPATCNTVYGLSARQQREGLLLLLRITSRPIPSVDAYEAPAAGTVPSTVLWASPQLNPAQWARHAAAGLTPRSASLVVWRWTREAS